MSARIKRRNEAWIKLSGDHAEFDSTTYFKDIAKEAMLNHRQTKGNFTKKSTLLYKPKKLTLEECRLRRKELLEARSEKFKDITHKPHKEKHVTNKELQLLTSTIYRIKCVLQNCTTDAPKDETYRKLNIFLNCKEQPAGNDENAHVSRYVKVDDKLLSKLSKTLRTLFPTLIHHIALTNNDKVEKIYTSPDIDQSKIHYFSTETLDLYNSIKLFKEQMFK